MNSDSNIIIKLARENETLTQRVIDLERERLTAEIAMRKVGVPGHFEDGNDSDDLSFSEQVSTLCDMYLRAKGGKP